MPRVSSTCCACSARSRRRSSSSGHAWLRVQIRLLREPPQATHDCPIDAILDGLRPGQPRAARHHRRGRAVGRHRRCQPPARRPRGAAADRRAVRLPRPGHRPDRRPRQPLRAHPHPVRGRRRRRPARARRRGGDGCAASPRRRPSRRRGRVPPGRERHRVGGRRDPAPAARPLARRPALRGRAGAAARARPLPARLAARASERGGLRGIDGVVSAIDQLAGVSLPASAWESLVLPSRVRDYSPAMLDELTTTGEVLWSGHGELPGGDGWLAPAPRRLRAAHPRRAGAHRAQRPARPHPRLPHRRRRVLLPPALAGARGRRAGRRQGARDRALGAGLGGHRLGRHPRAAAREARRDDHPIPRHARAAGRCAPAPASPPRSPPPRRRPSPAAGACCPPARRTRRPGRPRSPSSCSSGTAS